MRKALVDGLEQRQGILVINGEGIGDCTISTGNADIEVDSVNFLEGESAIKVTSTDAKVFAVDIPLATHGGNLDMSVVDNLAFYLHIPEKGKISIIQPYLVIDPGSLNFVMQKAQLKVGWNEICVNKTELTKAAAAASWNEAVIKLRLRITPVSGQYPSVTFDSVRVNYKKIPRVVVTFDDWYASVYTTAYPLMAQYGIPGTFHVATDKIGVSSNITKAHLTSLQDAGWLIANHTTDHTKLTTLETVDAIKGKVEGAIDWLEANGFADGARCLATPFGAENALCFEAFGELGLVYSRSVSAGIVENYAPPLQNKIYNKYDLQCVDFSAVPGLSTIAKYFDAARETGGSLILLFHHVAAGYTEPELFAQVMSYLSTSGLKCMTMKQFIEAQSTIPRMFVAR